MQVKVSLFLSDKQVTKPHCYYMSGKPLGNPWATFRQLILKTLFACEPTLNFLNVLTGKKWKLIGLVRKRRFTIFRVEPGLKLDLVSHGEGVLW